MIRTSPLGFPRIGKSRELKRLVESHFRGTLSANDLENAARELRLEHLRLQADRGITDVPSGDFSLYDHVLDLAQALGAVPSVSTGEELGPLEEYFLLARGKTPSGKSSRALEMTKWFDTNYHYLVPEIGSSTRFELRFNKARRAFQEALAAGVPTRPVLVGPVSFLLLSKNPDEGGPAPLTRLAELLPVYAQLLSELAEAGAGWVQLDEPCLALDLDAAAIAAFQTAYEHLGALAGPQLLLTTYFGPVTSHLSWLARLPVAGLHVDLARAPEQLGPVLESWPQERVLSLGVVDGRNVWKSDLEAILRLVEPAFAARSRDKLILSTSCSLLHAPVDLESESALDAEVKDWLAFGVQKLDELRVLARALDEGRAAVAAELEDNRRALERRRASARVHRPAVKARLAGLAAKDLARSLPFPERVKAQQKVLALPLLPTTTIGSFPQTDEIRRVRAAYKAQSLSEADYQAFIDTSIRDAIEKQLALGIDVLVHGEPERNDMVEYFASRMDGFAETENGWVQSYGTRCVKPPIIYGDVERKGPMTVREARVAQSFTAKPVKGMLTGPVTLLKWAFVRDDQPLGETARELALALRDEVRDLEEAGIRVIQVDEPALREGLPLRAAEHPAYLRWAVDAFRLATAGARSETQIHTHMCYAEFRDILGALVELDADVVSLEAARSRAELLEDFRRSSYPNDIGPGVYDIHSPRIPTTEEMATLLRRAAGVLAVERLWVNPDCGLKTRSWEEVTPALARMVEAAHLVRAELTASLSARPATGRAAAQELPA